MGHLDKITKDFGIPVEWIIDSKIFYDFTKRINLNKVSIKKEYVSLKNINKKLKKGFLITYIDGFYLWEKDYGLYFKYHFPHFIIILSKTEEKYRIIDPNDGIIKEVNEKVLLRGIKSLKRHLWMSPMIIRFNQK